MITPGDVYEIKSTLTRLDTKMEMLITNGGSKGIIPEMTRAVGKHEKQINFWRGAIAVIGGLLMIFGGTLLAHILKAAP